MVYDFKFLVLGRLVLFENGASSRKFINFPISLQGRILEGILSMLMTASCVYLAYSEGHHAYTKYGFEEADNFSHIKPTLTQLKSLFLGKIP